MVWSVGSVALLKLLKVLHCQLSKLDQRNHKLRNNRIAIEFDIFEKLCEMIAIIISVFFIQKTYCVQILCNCRGLAD